MFDFVPRLLIITAVYTASGPTPLSARAIGILAKYVGLTSHNYNNSSYDTSVYLLSTTISGHTITWYFPDTEQQLNEAGATYDYVGVG